MHPPAIPVLIAEGIRLRPIEQGDDRAVERLIGSVMAEFGADGEGFSAHDEEVRSMARAYTAERSEYWVLESQGTVVGGAGIAPLLGARQAVCELRKMYFLPEQRGFGRGRRLLEHLFERARLHSFDQVYLETLATMLSADRLYRSAGFVRIPGAIGDTGHTGCNRFFLRDLRWTTRVISLTDPLYEQERELRNEVLMRPMGIPDGAWEMYDAEALHLVALEGVRLVGSALLRPAEPGRAQLFQMAVASDRRRRGVGKLLITAILAEARRLGVREVFCHARDQAIPFYERAGFVVAGEAFVELGLGHHPMTIGLERSDCGVKDTGLPEHESTQDTRPVRERWGVLDHAKTD